MTAPGITSKQLPVAPRNRDTLPQPTKASHKGKSNSDEDWHGTGKAYIAGKTETEADSYDYDENGDKKKEVKADEIKKQGMYEVPEKFDDDDKDDKDDSKKDDKFVSKEDLSQNALKQGLYEVPEDEKEEGEEIENKMKEEDGRRRDSGMSRGQLSSLAENGGENNKEAVEQYEDSEVLDYAKKFKGKGRVVLDFSKGKENAKIIVYKYGNGKLGPDTIEERADSRLDKRRSSVEHGNNEVTSSTIKKAVICKCFLSLFIFLFNIVIVIFLQPLAKH